MRWLVTGGSGMLGRDVVSVLAAAGQEVTAAGRAELDVTEPGAAQSWVDGHDVVVHCAAYTAVDAAEEDEARAFDVNARGAGEVARAAHRAGARLVHVSTDYVLQGTSGTPCPEDAMLAPASAYGRTKAAGEWAVRAEGQDHLIVRTAWLYGAHGSCFPKTIAKVAAERGHVDVVDDQWGQPTWTRDLADLILRLVQAEAPAGIYHGTSGGACSWFDLAQAVVTTAGLDPACVGRTTSEAFARPAPRPAWSVLGHAALEQIGVQPVGPWRERWEASGREVLGR